MSRYKIVRKATAEEITARGSRRSEFICRECMAWETSTLPATCEKCGHLLEEENMIYVIVRKVFPEIEWRILQPAEEQAFADVYAPRDEAVFAALWPGRQS